MGNKYGYTVYSLTEDTVGSLDRIEYDLIEDKDFVDGDLCIVTNTTYGCSAVGLSTGSKMTFDDGAKCVANGGSNNGCRAAEFSNGGACIANTGAKTGCNGTVFNHAYCVGNSSSGAGSCRANSSFNEYSVCYANASNTCIGEYDPTSCCVGDTYCPEGKKCSENPYWEGREIPDMPTYP